MTDPTYEVPMGTIRIPVPCGPQTVAIFTTREIVRDNGFVDTEITVTRSCGHWYFATYEPVIGGRAMTCLGPQIETVRSGRADPTLPPMKKGKRWTKLSGTTIERGVSLRIS